MDEKNSSQTNLVTGRCPAKPAAWFLASAAEGFLKETQRDL
jgi:hypothetical protein